MFTFDDSDAAAELADRARRLMEEVVLPKERELPGGMGVSDSTVRELREAAREYGVYAPQIAEEHGGMGYEFRDVLPTFEQAGRSILGPLAMRVDAPDEGNMHLLEMQGTEIQKEQYLEPLVAGDIASGFSMTEPLQGAGSDPKMIQTTAEKDGDEWIIDGHKWWTTQGIEADVLLVLARTNPDVHPYEGCSVFVVPAEANGVEVVRDIPHLGGHSLGTGHAEIKFDHVRVPEEHLLGEEGEGFTHVQERLGPARLTHCMRFSGMAERALSIARAYSAEREAFGTTLAEKQHARFEIAERETQVQAARAMVRAAADAITAGQQARTEVSASKVFAARATGAAIDTAVQYCGANGIGRDLPLADFYESVRTFRIVDGADEVHLRTIARELFEDVDEAELEPVLRYGE
ncbi:acyl-CoA dehydrogenase [Salinarchaeum sp. Harcht-Bsk1]|uniref:acyl-CoA dehydrogenase family protein n=1 Tax=Salinarchaeum sp. Harcht-Bsk1 TaxID=1333523 RepID=UPI0003422A8F|nr:acyl-CoA dehydrogenase family protein [Salinarchaeum sp. Harcht-Bsk1]AGN00162.1 acyl-CoA dehydrogenase [Salinarchaeum sp. Harcht-Bsk1]